MNRELIRQQAQLELARRDFFYYTWEEIGAKLHMSRKTIYRKRRVILEKFAQLL